MEAAQSSQISIMNSSKEARSQKSFDELRVACVASKIHSMARAKPTSKYPILILEQNGQKLRCCRSRSNKDLVWFYCPRKVKKCPFSMRVKMMFTDDPENPRYWEYENWQICEIIKYHNCCYEPDNPTRSDPYKNRRIDLKPNPAGNPEFQAGLARSGENPVLSQSLVYPNWTERIEFS